MVDGRFAGVDIPTAVLAYVVIPQQYVFLCEFHRFLCRTHASVDDFVEHRDHAWKRVNARSGSPGSMPMFHLGFAEDNEAYRALERADVEELEVVREDENVCCGAHGCVSFGFAFIGVLEYMRRERLT